jgi:hypothetical protein
MSWILAGADRHYGTYHPKESLRYDGYTQRQKARAEAILTVVDSVHWPHGVRTQVFIIDSSK